MSKKLFKPGDIVDIRAQVTDVDDTGAVTVEVACAERKYKHKVTLTGGQITDAVTFVEKGELPEPDAPHDPFANKTVEVADTLTVADKNNL